MYPIPELQLVIIDVYHDGSCLYIVQDAPLLDADLAAWRAQDDAYIAGAVPGEEYLDIAAWLEKKGYQALPYRSVAL